MAQSPQFKVYDRNGTYQAACKEPQQAAALMAFLGEGATIRCGHGAIVWREGRGEDGWACDSYDRVTVTVWDRVNQEARERFIKRYGQEAFDQAMKQNGAKED